MTMTLGVTVWLWEGMFGDMQRSMVRLIRLMSGA